MTNTPNYIRVTTRRVMTLGCTLIGCFAFAEAALLDLSTNDSGVINGAIYRIDDSAPAGTGIFGRDAGGVFSRIKMNGDEHGYNTSATGVMNNHDNGSGWNRDLLYSTLRQVSIDGTQYVPFILDINEASGQDKPLITLQSIKIFSTSTVGLSYNDINDLAADSSTSLLYDMDTVQMDSSVLLDYDRTGTGSGAADMGLFVPAGLFDAVQEGEHIILYSSFSGADGGFEEWTPGAGEDPEGPIIIVPEPSTGMLGAIGLMLILRRRNR